MYFLVDYPNIPLSVEKCIEGKEELILNLNAEKTPAVYDLVRANRFNSDLEEAIAFWSVCMEAEVTKVYTDKNPKQIGRIVSEGIINMKINVFQGKEFIPVDFLQLCKDRKAFPAFKIAFGWVASTENARSEDHLWGFKFELSTFPQYTATRRVRSGAVSAAESVAGTKKKRKAELEAEVVVDSEALTVVAEVVA